uniref:Uncharacterized protein n=1 Tax=Nelumbo nucifera TaxID=4432 RepID=A0A822YYY4_NELNU|nr:TPA_asm: hypothetical protein HUJ06_008533 [Nelumbo nucifera]
MKKPPLSNGLLLHFAHTYSQPRTREREKTSSVQWSPFASFVLREILFSFFECCISQKGRSLPSKKSLSAVNILSPVEFLERNLKSTLRTGTFSRFVSSFFGNSECGLMEMKSLSSMKLTEKEIRGLDVGSMEFKSRVSIGFTRSTAKGVSE